jgi:FtsH-binding integral membrane protein
MSDSAKSAENQKVSALFGLFVAAFVGCVLMGIKEVFDPWWLSYWFIAAGLIPVWLISSVHVFNRAEKEGW